jgi:hypothetical protein
VATKTTKRISKTKSLKTGTKRTAKTTSKAARQKAVARTLAREDSSIVKRRKKLQQSISQIPPERLSEVENKIREVLTTRPKNEPKSLAGIWAGKGFENIDLEKALKEARDAMLRGTLNKSY